MRKIAVVLALLVATQRANACTDAAWIPDWFAYGFAGAIAGSYAYGTGYFIEQDMAGDRRDHDYVVGELAFNGIAGTLWGAGAISEIEDGHIGAAIPLTGMTLVHGALLAHAIPRLDFGNLHLNGNGALMAAGTAYALETLVFVAGVDDDHGRTYGLVEAGVQLPIAAGLGVLAYQHGRDGDVGSMMLIGGAAAISGALAVHGIATAISPYDPPKLDLLGTDLMPTVVDDGKEIGPGIGAAGTF